MRRALAEGARHRAPAWAPVRDISIRVSFNRARSVHAERDGHLRSLPKRRVRAMLAAAQAAEAPGRHLVPPTCSTASRVHHETFMKTPIALARQQHDMLALSRPLESLGLRLALPMIGTLDRRSRVVRRASASDRRDWGHPILDITAPDGHTLTAVPHQGRSPRSAHWPSASSAAPASERRRSSTRRDLGDSSEGDARVGVQSGARPNRLRALRLGPSPRAGAAWPRLEPSLRPASSAMDRIPSSVWAYLLLRSMWTCKTGSR